MCNHALLALWIFCPQSQHTDLFAASLPTVDLDWGLAYGHVFVALVPVLVPLYYLKAVEGLTEVVLRFLDREEIPPDS